MRTRFTDEQLAQPAAAQAEKILSSCTNCGCCNAACPTYELTGDERESPRGRINLIHEMLAQGGAPKPDTVTHLDNCLSCLSCTVACPSGVDYMHLIDQAREHVEQHHRRPIADRLMRGLMAWVLPSPTLMRTSMAAGRFARPLAGWLRRHRATRALGAMLAALPAPSALETEPPRRGVHAAVGLRRKRVLLPLGCVQQVMDAAALHSAIRLLTHLGVEVIVPAGDGCCGAIEYHLGKTSPALAKARANVEAWLAVANEVKVDAIIVTASGCGHAVQDYGHLLQDDPVHAAGAARVADLAMDLATFLGDGPLPAPKLRPGLRVAYHAACSLQHGQRRLNEPKTLLRQAGYTVLTPRDEHLCCGSAGTYSLLQPDNADRLRERKAGTLAALQPDVVVGGNIGCLQHLAPVLTAPVVHTVFLLEWAWTGVRPQALAGLQARDAQA